MPQIFVENLQTGYFVGGYAGSDGSFDAPPLEGVEGDTIQFSFETEDRDGGVICLYLSFSATEIPLENETCVP